MPRPAAPYSEFRRYSLSLCRPPRRRPATRCKLKQVIKEFSVHCKTVRDINEESIGDWFDEHPDRSPLTSFSLLRSFARAVRLAAKKGIVPSDPFQSIPPSQWFSEGDLEPPDKIRHLTSSQIRKLMRRARWEAKRGGWVELRTLLVLETCASTGCRAKEALGLQRADFDFRESLLYFRPNDRRPLKARASKRRLPMVRRVRDVAKRFFKLTRSIWAVPHKEGDGPWFGGRPGHKPLDAVKALGVRAGVQNVTLLKLRHGFATAIERVSSPLIRQRYLGHRRATMQYGYGHEDLDALRGVSRQINF